MPRLPHRLTQRAVKCINSSISDPFLKNRTLTFFIIGLSLTAITAVTFLVLFIVAQSQVGSLRKKTTNLQSQLSQARSAQVFDGSLSPGVPEKQVFISQLDGTRDNIAILPPNSLPGQKDLTLVVYLHGMGSTYMEPFLTPKDATISQALTAQNPGIILASLNYRGQSAWANNEALADIDQNIHELLQRFPISKIVIMGTSMGGCSSLAYSYLAAEDIKAKMVGVVSAEPAGDLVLLYEKEHSQIVKNGMVGAFGGPPQLQPQGYISRSILKNMDKVPSHLRYAIISSTRDTVIPPSFQQAVVSSLEEKQIAAKLIEVDEEHGVPSAQAFVKGLNFVVLGNAAR
jgi:acetyl esterase/lipase